MIKTINTSGRYIEVLGGGSTGGPSRNYGSSNHMQGTMMYDLEAQCIKVYDGQSWIVLHGSHATINLTYEAESLLNWARQKRDEEHARSKIVEQYPQLEDASKSLAEKIEEFELLVTLAKAHKTKEQQ
jgi:hypothetical protein